LAQGTVSYLSQSKWLNQILIFTTSATAINNIKNLSFVKSVDPVGPAATSAGPKIDKFKETLTPIKPGGIKQPNTAITYDYGSSYGQIHIHNGEFLHQRGFTGRGMVIAIIDAGFYHYKTTAAFDSTRAHNRFLGEKDFVDFDNSVNEDYNHGELCLSTIAANVPGVMVGTAPNASFWLLRSEDVNSEYPIEEHNYAAAAEFADSAGADLISCSLGYFQFDDPQFDHTYNDFYKNTTMISRAATYAAKKGMLVTNSAGNEGGGSWNYIIFPADDDSVCTVAATDVSGNIAGFSSYGYPGKVKPNIASVGSGTVLYSPSGLTSGSGTSFSNPNINGLIACLWQAFPEFNNMAILNAVYQSSDRYNTPDNHYGFGIPNMQNAFKALKALRNQRLYGKEWLFVNNTTFNSSLEIKLIGRLDGDAKLELLDADKKIVASMKVTTEEQEVYELSFKEANNLPAGVYTLQYTDGSTTKTVRVTKGTTIAKSEKLSKPVVAGQAVQ
jgi:subtilisin family serine protease